MSIPRDVSTGANPYSRSRPLLSLLRQPLNLLGAVVAVGWIFFAPDYRVFTVSTGLIIGVLALGLMVMVGWAREINLAAAGVYATSLYLGSWVYRPAPNGWGHPLLIAIGVAVVIGILMMLAVAIFSVRLSGVYVMVFTLGVQILVERIVFTQYRLTGGDQGLVTPSPRIFGYEVSSHDDRAFYLFVLSVVALGARLPPAVAPVPLRPGDHARGRGSAGRGRGGVRPDEDQGPGVRGVRRARRAGRDPGRDALRQHARHGELHRDDVPAVAVDRDPRRLRLDGGRARGGGRVPVHPVPAGEAPHQLPAAGGHLPAGGRAVRLPRSRWPDAGPLPAPALRPGGPATGPPSAPRSPRPPRSSPAPTV